MNDIDGMDFFEDGDQIMSESAAGTLTAPSGDYEAVIVEAENTTSKAGNKMSVITFQVDGGNYRDHREYFNLWHPKDEVQEIARRNLSILCKKLGLKSYPNNIEDLKGSILKVTLEKYEDGTYVDKNDEEKPSFKNKILGYEMADKEEIPIPKVPEKTSSKPSLS